jgi:hypothetical protein
MSTVAAGTTLKTRENPKGQRIPALLGVLSSWTKEKGHSCVVCTVMEAIKSIPYRLGGLLELLSSELMLVPDEGAIVFVLYHLAFTYITTV